MAIDDERTKLKDKTLSEGERAKLCEEISDMVRMWFRMLYKTASVTGPTSLKEPTDGTRPGPMDIYFLENRAFFKLHADQVKKEAAAGLLPQ